MRKWFVYDRQGQIGTVMAADIFSATSQAKERFGARFYRVQYST